jgi:hypothetical protein
MTPATQNALRRAALHRSHTCGVSVRDDGTPAPAEVYHQGLVKPSGYVCVRCGDGMPKARAETHRATRCINAHCQKIIVRPPTVREPTIAPVLDDKQRRIARLTRLRDESTKAVDKWAAEIEDRAGALARAVAVAKKHRAEFNRRQRALTDALAGVEPVRKPKRATKTRKIKLRDESGGDA